MKLVEALESGACGVQFKLPSHVTVRVSEREGLVYTDARAELEWMVHFGDLTLDLTADHDAVLTADVRQATRAIYDATAANLDARAPKSARRPDAHAADPAWSPLVSAAPVALSVTTALQVIHYAAEREGLRVVLGHLLVPTQYGVVEFRVTATDRAPLPDTDSPKHAAARVRAALDDLRAPGVVEVTRAALAPTVGDVTLPAFGGGFTLPARFALVGDPARDVILFTRMSVGNTDGVWRLGLVREAGDAISRQRALRKRVETALATHFGLADLRTARVELSHADDGTARVLVQHDGPLASVWWLHPDGGLRGLQLSGPQGTALGDVVALLLPAAASWRVVADA